VLTAISLPCIQLFYVALLTAIGQEGEPFDFFGAMYSGLLLYSRAQAADFTHTPENWLQFCKLGAPHYFGLDGYYYASHFFVISEWVIVVQITVFLVLLNQEPEEESRRDL